MSSRLQFELMQNFEDNKEHFRGWWLPIIIVFLIAVTAGIVNGCNKSIHYATVLTDDTVSKYENNQK